ncbi:MAG: hypothetical protein EOP04_09650 [Proteobacteria bacterium]|nr:MAG: hypothetical protein EOP04_09650 [Pseudomonadota bacterium]
MSFVYNRTDPPRVVHSGNLTRQTVDLLRSVSFEQITGKRPNSNVPALDTALVQTISYWKRELSASSDVPLSNDSLSALFNQIIFARAAEDHFRTLHLGTRSPSLSEMWADGVAESLPHLLLEFTNKYRGVEDFISRIDERLEVFRLVDRSLLTELLSDFYSNRYARLYEYNFSLISKHALSRVYEHYVSLLRLEDSAQATLFPRLPEEDRNKAFGSFYTPQYIARFFARYLRESHTPSRFKTLRTIDPACGSGVFLRTLLELQCDPLQDTVLPSTIENVVNKTVGIDIDPNATEAAKLSISLLHLVLLDRLPSTLPIITAEALEYFSDHPNIVGSFDAVLMNPPFVRWEMISEELKLRLQSLMGADGTGRQDLYLPFVKMALELLKPGGFACVVVPQTFLMGVSSSKMRKMLSERSWIHCLADLSAIRVFEDASAYVSLIIFQKKADGQPEPPATLVKCQEFVGHALSDALIGKESESPYYSVYQTDQSHFKQDRWIVSGKQESALQTRLSYLPKTEEFLTFRQGYVTGADRVFIRDEKLVPRDERSLYVPFLSDREIMRYATPKSVDKLIFYPLMEDGKIGIEEIKRKYPEAFEHLEKHRADLEKRKSIRNYRREWWEPMWARPRENMLRPKLVSPHICAGPRFALDSTGKYAVSRSPIIYPKNVDLEREHLLYFLGVLNSPVAFWYMGLHSANYGKGYLQLDSFTLREVRVPHPMQVDSGQLLELTRLVESRLGSTSTMALKKEKEIDDLVARMYGLSASDRRALGID